MWKSRLSIFFAGFNGAIAAKLYEWLYSEVDVPFAIALIVSALTAAFAQSVMEFLCFEAPLSFEYTRRLFDPISRVEGYRLEQVCTNEGTCHYSYACIAYDGKGKYKYYGLSFEYPSYELRANFGAGADEMHLVGDSSTVKMYYSFRAKLYKVGKDQSHDSTGNGVLDFYSDGSRGFNRGEGYFIDNTGKISEMELILTRITKEDALKFVQKEHSFTTEEIQKLVEEKVKELSRK